jgi:hypothetical protein
VNARFDVVHGNPNDEELAVVVSLLTAASCAAPFTAPEPTPSIWARPGLRVTLASGPGAWYASGLPR